MAIDPRKGLHRNLNLLEAYQVYEQDYPLFLPDISATLALNSPLFDRINETLTLQSLNKTEFEQDEAQLRAAAMAGGVPLDQLREAFRIFRDAQTPPPPPGGMPAPPNAPPPSAPEPALGPRPGVPTVLGPSLNRVQAQTNAANGERLMAAQVRVAEAQQNVERNRATAASVATTLQGGQTPAQRMTQDLISAAAAYAASQSHDGAPDAREEMARWILNHQEEIENYMRRNPGISSENAARDVYSLMSGRPVSRGPPTSFGPDTGARGSNDPAPPTSSGTTTEQTNPSAELRRRPPPRERDQKRRRRSEPAALVPEGDQIVNVDAPPGTLGLVFKRDSTVLAKVLETSPLRDKVQVGWTLVSVDGEDVEMLNGWQTTRLLQAQAAAGRKLAFAVPARAADQPGPLGRVAAALSALSPRGRSGAAVPVVAGDVVAEVMEREAPTAGEPGEAVGSIEFIGLWKRENKKSSRLMPLKMEGGIWYGSESSDDYDLKVRVALARLVDKLVRNKAPSGLLAISNWTQKVSSRTGEGNSERRVYYTENFWGISWSARPDDERYQQLGLISREVPRCDDRWRRVAFAGFDGFICRPGDELEAKNAVYRVTLPRESFDPWKWVSRPPPPAPEDLYTGPRDDGLLSTEEISGDYRCCCFPFVCQSMSVVPLGADVIETWNTCCLFLPPLIGPMAGGEVRTRDPGANTFGGMTFSAGGRAGCFCKCPGSQQRAFHKVETRDLAGKWRGCGCSLFVQFWPFSFISCTTKKALDQDRYEVSEISCCLCLPCSDSGTRTRVYVNGHPTNGFAEDDGSGVHWHRGPGCAGSFKDICTFIAKKVG